jgi:NAD(P)-dependent dehydrogenase (short-subunit alcohol dehydrogenase family)
MNRQSWSLQGKVILITGGAGGLGAAVAAQLVRLGAVPVLADVDAAALARAAASIGGGTSTALLDVTDYAACEAAVAGVLEQHGRLDAVWANAGIGAGGPFELVEAEVWTRVIQVNLIGVYNIIRAALAAVIDSRGYVLITASVASFAHPPALSAYSASKAGVEALGNSLRIEVAHQGVDVGIVHPSWIATSMVTEADAESRVFQRLRRANRPPFRKTYPVDVVVQPIIDAFANRERKIFIPGFARIAHILRAVLHTRPFERDYLKAAPQMRQLFAEQAERDGARLAALGTRWAKD